jgi:IS5 family transposase
LLRGTLLECGESSGERRDHVTPDARGYDCGGNKHSLSDSTLLAEGVRVLTRTMKKITKIAGAVGTKLCDRSRSVNFRLLEVGRVARAKAKGVINRDKLKQRYGQLLNTTTRVVGQAKRFSAEIVQGVKQETSVMKQLALEGLRDELDEMVPLVRQVMKQTRARIFRGNTRSEGKLVSLFEPSTEIIRKGKASSRPPIAAGVDSHERGADGARQRFFQGLRR